MFQSHIGEIAALGTVICWTVSSLSFEYSGKKIGSLTLNFVRLVMGVAALSLYLFITRGYFLPLHSTSHVWIWMAISGVVGYGLGDLFLFQAFVVVGARVSMLIMALSPPITALIGWLFLGEQLGSLDFLGMALAITGVSIVILRPSTEKRTMKFAHPVMGVLLAFGGAVFQGLGLVLSKYGIENDNAVSASLIRAIAGSVVFGLILLFSKRMKYLSKAVKHTRAMSMAFLGAFFGPFIGVTLSIFAVQHTATGIASTITSIVPVVIILPSVLFFHEKITVREVLGALIAVGGVGILFM